MKSLVTILLIAILSSGAFAAPEDNVAEPEIIIKEMEDKVVHEYRLNGMLYAVKVFPNKGKPYYLIAEEGGEYFTRVDEPRMLVPSWEIFTW